MEDVLSSIRYIIMILLESYLLAISSDTVSLFLPFALRRANTFLPLTVDILSLKPCLFFLFLLDG